MPSSSTNINWLLGPLGPSDEDLAVMVKLRQALSRQTIAYFDLNYKPFFGLNGPPEIFQQIDAHQATHAFVCYGTLEFLREVRKRFSLTPGVYYNQERLKTSGYLHHFPAEAMLNASGFYLPWGQLKQTPLRKIQQALDCTSVFVKSDSGFKVFPGMVLDDNNYESAMKTIEYCSSVSDDTLCLLSPCRRLRAEYRFVICNRDVVTGSQYMLHGKYHPALKVDHQAQALAQQIAQNPWQPDLVYTCDVGMVASSVAGSKSKFVPQVVELNSFSGAGLYLGDLDKIVSAVSKTALLEFQGELSLEDKPESQIKLKF